MKNYAKSLLALMLTATMALSSSAPAIAVSDAAPAAIPVSSEGCSDTVAAAPEDTVISENTKAAVTAMEQQISDELISQTLPQRMNSAVSVTTKTGTVTSQTTVSESSASAGSSSQDSEAPQENDGESTSQKDDSGLLPYGISMEELCPGFATGDKTTSDSFPKNIDVTESPEDYFAAKYGEEFRNRPRASGLPSSADISKSIYFPEVDSQGGIGACVCWSQVYYQFTYTYNKSRGIVTTPQNTFSPMFTYSHINSGIDVGSFSNDAYNDMAKFGCATLVEVPYGDDYLSLSAKAEIFRNAANRKVKEYHTLPNVGDKDSLITSVDDSDLDALKTVLANGDIVSMTSGILKWRLGNLKDPGVSGINEGAVGDVVVLCNDGDNGGHRMTIVGYNDKIWTDLNNNNKIDSGEMGAFKIVNSWGKGVGTNGFYWIPYDTLNYKSVVENAVLYENRKTIMQEFTWMEVMPADFEPRYFLSMTLSTKERGDKEIKVIGKWANSVYSTTATPSLSDTSDTYHSFDKTQNETVGEFVMDVSYVMNKLGTDKFNEVEWSVEYADKKANGRPLTVKDTYFYDEKDLSAEYSSNEFPFTVENSSRIITFNQPVSNNAIIYYRGYKDPVIRYKLGNTWSQSSGEKMKYTIEEYGYVNKYVIPLGSYTTTDIMFGDGNGKWDTNSGNYYKATAGIQYFETKGVAEPMVLTYNHYASDVADLNTSDYFYATTTGGYAPYKYRLEVMDVNSGAMFLSTEYGKPSSTSANVHNSGLKFSKESKFKITVYSMDAVGTVVSKSHYTTVKDMPLTFTELLMTPEKTIYQPGDIVTLSAAVENDSFNPSSRSYSLALYKDGKEKERMVFNPTSYSMQTFKSNGSMVLTLSESGKYTAVVSRTSMKNELAFKTLEFEVAPTSLKLSSVTVSPENSIGVGCPVTVKAAASGGSGTVSYSYSLSRYGTVIQTSDSTAASAVLTMPAQTGPCTIQVTAKDSSGTQTSYTKDLWVNPVVISDITFPSSGLYNNTNIKIGSTVKFDSGMNAANYVYTAIKGSSQTVLKTNTDKTATLNVKDTGEYTIRLDIKNGDKVLTSMSKKLTIAENPVPSDHLITVAVISYIENEGSQSNYRLHYWNNGGLVGDATMVPTGQTVSRSLGSEYWGGSFQTFKVYEAHVPTEATGYKFHIGDRWFGADGNIATSNMVLVYNYSGDKALYVNH